LPHEIAIESSVGCAFFTQAFRRLTSLSGGTTTNFVEQHPQFAVAYQTMGPIQAMIVKTEFNLLAFVFFITVVECSD
jgi:hypothetical protein